MSPRYRVEISQHGVVDVEFYETFSALALQHFNWALTNCQVVSCVDRRGAFTERELAVLAENTRAGEMHWSHLVTGMRVPSLS